MNIRKKYSYETKNYKEKNDKKNSWDRTLITIYENVEKNKRKKIGSYKRNYHTMYNTFEPFKQDGKHYALISNDYTSTSVISLPECEIIATEGNWNCFGFCPTGFYVPIEKDKNVYFENDMILKKLSGKFGFVCGCVWGDDQSWKIQFLDLSEINNGKVIRDDRFGYIESLSKINNLSDAFKYIYCDEEEEIQIEIECIKRYDITLKQNLVDNKE